MRPRNETGTTRVRVMGNATFRASAPDNNMMPTTRTVTTRGTVPEPHTVAGELRRQLFGVEGGPALESQPHGERRPPTLTAQVRRLRERQPEDGRHCCRQAVPFVAEHCLIYRGHSTGSVAF